MKKFSTATLALMAGATMAFAGVEAHWDYAKHGPQDWGHFSKTCKEGKEQSPINIETEKTQQLDHSYTIKLSEDYKGVSTVVDNGHSLKVTPVDAGYVSLHAKEYKLKQFHFHGMSEHTIDGRRYNAVAHFVHMAKDGSVAVIAVMFEVGEENPALTKILNAKAKVTINPNDLLPEDTDHYYHYKGSFTTPPCTEGVEWYIFKDTVNISKSQLDALRKYYRNNERPTQPLNKRVVQTK
ncbi:carbonic anhydrase family protein [Sulfurimonas sp. SWIR-19]|uniref:carbonic anhydrase n=1 Tax=Sulfurimonas sp. SWIR-19 TaxID=2878390 RepID=UPI001CF56583|nr:carbonic anhydrase family protein [Sulfurimonas sp. SWIR-19]UCN00418.1 carbonic anhydrase family protein [Sulfurimonas sp. SWIR-19]